MRPAARLAVPLNNICSRTCDRPAPSQRPSSTLPALHQAWAETTGALWSSRMMSVRPFSRVSSRTPGGMAGIAVLVSAAVLGVRLSIIRPKDTSNRLVPSLKFLGGDKSLDRHLVSRFTLHVASFYDFASGARLVL